jgi:uncharacterized protein YyaL (SSP411 family)
MPNRLSRASSPYLLQHKDNPVDWWEWSPEALAEAVTRDVPIFLSVGYSACHWCHVMAHESFEDPETAAYMNDHFVNVKVDREERPDIDRIYMDAVQAMTGQGGWPMSVFLTPDGRPVFAGTYFPPGDVGHRPSFGRVMEAVNDAWTNRRDELDEQAERLTAAVRRTIRPSVAPPSTQVVRSAVVSLLRNIDPEHGGFGGAPKFPQAPSLELLLRRLAVEPGGGEADEIASALRLTLDRMAAGGIYDHLGGGFARYAVDRNWLVPHFEKMLYDNALLARVYLRAWQLLGVDRYRTVATQTLDYLIRDMTDPGGGFHAAEDADSEGIEGKFYVWDRAEVRELLGDDAEIAERMYGITEAGNFEGANILHEALPPDRLAVELGIDPGVLAEIRARSDAALTARRDERVRPGRDDKVITAWNGLAIRAFAEAGAVLGEARYLDAAAHAARFCLEVHVTDTRRVLRSTRGGTGDIPGFCDDYASLSLGLTSLFEATGDTAWFEAALRLAGQMIDLFAGEEPGFYATGRDAEQLITRPKNYMDNPTPSDNSLAAEALQRLHALTGERRFREHLEGVFVAGGELMARYPAAAGHVLAVRAVDPPREVAVVGAPGQRAPLQDVVWESFRPDVVLAHGEPDATAVPLLRGRPAGDGTALAYVCRDFACEMPVGHPAELRAQLAHGTERG